MKRLIMLTILLAISLTNQLQAQKIDKTIQLDNDVFTKKYTLEVSDDLKFNIKSTVKDGKLIVNIYNPKGELHDEMELDASIGQSRSTGTIDESLDDAMPGIWTFEITNKRALGEVKIDAKS